MERPVAQAFQDLQSFSDKDLQQFKTVCNALLSRTFIPRTVCRDGKGGIPNSNYAFLSAHFSTVGGYLSLLDWELFQDSYNGYFWVRNTDEANRLNLNKAATAILLALRMIYDENQDRLGLEHDALCTVGDVLEKMATDYPILSAKPNMDEVRRALSLFENHSLLQRLDGKFSQTDCRFVILPTILTAVSSEKLQDVVAKLRKRDTDETPEENSADELALFLETGH